MHRRWEKATVVEIVNHVPGMQYVKVKRIGGDKEEKAIHYTDGWQVLREGDEVVLNTTAVDLSLGSGGYHFVAWKVNHIPSSAPLHGHIMKLRYTPWQGAVLAVEEPESPYHETLKSQTSLNGMPVLAGELHSMLPILVTSLQQLAKQHGRRLRIAYVMTDGAALPAYFSQHVLRLRDLNWLSGTVTVGHAYGGDLEAVNVYSGLLAARHVFEADVTIVLMGPGIVGTGTVYGFTGVEQGQTVNAVCALEGIPIVVPRISFSDSRSRHRGISHHTLTNLSRVIMCPARVPVPTLLPTQWQQIISEQIARLEERKRVLHEWVQVPLTEAEMRDRLERYPCDITSMGRGLSEDPAFFYGVSSAADVAWSVLNEEESARC